MKFLRLDWLLVMVPVAGWLHFTSDNHVAIFICACIAIIPIAGWMGKATEHLAERSGDGIGGLLNATFGNAAELIIAVMALYTGYNMGTAEGAARMHEVVRASITGSIIGNLLLVLGASFLLGGLRHRTQKFNASAARTYGTILLLAAVALVMPATFHHLAGNVPGARDREHNLSLEISMVLMLSYFAVLWFSLHSHKQLFVGESAAAAQLNHDEEAAGTAAAAHQPWSMWKAVSVLIGATALIAVVAEWMVGSVEQAAHSMGMSNVFVGVIVVAIVGNAAEHSTSIMMALKNRMDLAIGIALGSSAQIALFVAPVLVFVSYAFGAPLDLVFTPAEVLAIVASVWITEQVVSDGESNWLEGFQLLALYAILGAVFYLLPSATGGH